VIVHTYPKGRTILSPSAVRRNPRPPSGTRGSSPCKYPTRRTLLESLTNPRYCDEDQHVNHNWRNYGSSDEHVGSARPRIAHEQRDHERFPHHHRDDVDPAGTPAAISQHPSINGPRQCSTINTTNLYNSTHSTTVAATASRIKCRCSTFFTKLSIS
jgi:hypothetical protein